MAPAISFFEALILMRQRPAKLIHEVLQPVDRIQLRATSTVTQNWIEECDSFFNPAFRSLYIRNRTPKSVSALKHIAGNCYNFSIALHDGATSISSDIWSEIFLPLRRLTTLKISTHGPSDWAYTNALSETLIQLRSAVENSGNRELTSLCLKPIRAPDVLALRSCGTAFGNSGWASRPLWETLTSLEVQMVNPLHSYSKRNRLDFYKSLHSFLASLRFSLKTLKWHWAFAMGPNPLLLDEKCGPKEWGQGPIIWANLDQLWLSHVQVWPEHFKRMAWRATKLLDAYILYDGLEGDEDGYVRFVPGKQWRLMELDLRDFARRATEGGKSEELYFTTEDFGEVTPTFPTPDSLATLPSLEGASEPEDPWRMSDMTSFTRFLQSP